MKCLSKYGRRHEGNREWPVWISLCRCQWALLTDFQINLFFENNWSFFSFTVFQISMDNIWTVSYSNFSSILLSKFNNISIRNDDIPASCLLPKLVDWITSWNQLQIIPFNLCFLSDPKSSPSYDLLSELTCKYICVPIPSRIPGEYFIISRSIYIWTSSYHIWFLAEVKNLQQQHKKFSTIIESYVAGWVGVSTDFICNICEKVFCSERKLRSLF